VQPVRCGEDGVCHDALIIGSNYTAREQYSPHEWIRGLRWKILLKQVSELLVGPLLTWLLPRSRDIRGRAGTMPTMAIPKSWFDPRLEKRASPIHGTGIFYS